MKNSIVEDIKILEKIDIKSFINGITEQSDYIIDKADELNTAIEHILSNYKRVLKENEELVQEKINNQKIIALSQNDMLNYQIEKYKEHIEKLQKENERLNTQIQYDVTHIYTPQTIELNYIPLQKVKDKIEELNNNKENYTFERLTSKDIRKTVVTNLQELLERED